MARIIREDGTEQTVQPKDPSVGFKLKGEVYDHLHCDIVEMHSITPDEDGNNIMLIDEEGKLAEEKEFNAKATELWSKTHGIPVAKLVESGDHIVGDVLVCKEDEFR